MSVAGPARKGMSIGRWAAGQTWVDGLGDVKEKVVLDERGCGEFGCGTQSVSVWVREGSVPAELWENVGRGDGFKL